MPKVTSKLQLTVPKAIADQYGIRPGDELQWMAAGEVIRVIPANKSAEHEQSPSLEQRLELFDKATHRQQKRQAARPKSAANRRTGDRGWKREDLYERGFPR